MDTGHIPAETQVYTIGDLLSALNRHRAVIAVITLACVALTATYAWLARPVYRAEVLAVPVEQEESGGLGALVGQFGGLASIAGIDLGGDSRRDETLAVLTSTAFLTRFVEDRQLMPTLFASDWDTTNKRWLDPDDPPTMGDALKLLRRKILSVGVDDSGTLIRLRVDWYDAGVAADWANDLVRRLNASMRNEAMARARRSIDYLNAELEQQSAIEVRQAIYRLVEHQIKGAMVASVNVDYVLRVIDAAVPADRDKFVRPRRWLLLALGVLGGFSLGAAVAVVLDARRRRNRMRAGDIAVA